MTDLPVVAVILAVTLGVAGCSSTREAKDAPGAIRTELSAAEGAARRARPQPSAVQAGLAAPPVELSAADSGVPERFDLSVADAPVRRVFMSLVSGTPYSVLVHPSVSGSVTVSLKDVTLTEALEALRELYGYEYRVDGKRIYVQSAGMSTRVFKVNYLVGQRVGRSDVRITSGSVSDASASGAAGGPGGAGAATPAAPGSTQSGAASAIAGRVSDSGRVLTSTHSDFWGELRDTLRSIVGSESGRNVIVNPQAGIVVVRAMPVEMRQIDAYLRAIRGSVERQVMLEAKIVEVTLSEGFQSGVNWASFRNGNAVGGTLQPNTALGTSGTLSNGQVTANPSGGTLSRSGSPDMAGAAPGLLVPGLTGGSMLALASQRGNFSSLLQFLESQGTVQVLSSPRIAALNNQKAVLKVGTDEFFVTNVTGGSSGASSGATAGTTTFPTLVLQPFFSGVALDVTPQIDDDGSVILHMHPQVSSVQQDNRSLNLGGVFGGEVVLPTARSTVSETDSIVRVYDGNIVAIGGLMKVDIVERSSGIPGLNSLPVIGFLFGSRDRLHVKKELVILIKPTVVNADADLPGGRPLLSLLPRETSR
ncbi:MAG: secretin N-terminal domain-containing protein [Betaproteobacteria bacterium]|nr:secretin N-terminal domain-containing protein [Betaproteobacteria bacterium]